MSDIWTTMMQQASRNKSRIYHWTVREFLEFFEILKLSGQLEIYYAADPSFRRIANRLYNLLEIK